MITEEQERAIVERVICMPESGTDDFEAGLSQCGYYAIQNLYRLCNLEPPSLQKMLDVLPSHEGLFTGNGAAILAELGFPGIVVLGFIPPGQDSQRDYSATPGGWHPLADGLWLHLNSLGGGGNTRTKG